METEAGSTIPDFLRFEFANLIRQLNGNEDAAKAWSDSLISAYSELQRHYHTASHISSMLNLSQSYNSLINKPHEVQLAIYFHDWVYDPKAHDNETQSISIFREFAAELNLNESLVKVVSRYIEATITHSLAENDEVDEDLKLFLDFDLEVLGRERGAYEVYAKQIKNEYGHFSDLEYAKGRVSVLEKFLRREKLFFSEVVGEKLEVRARENLKAEIADLQAR